MRIAIFWSEFLHYHIARISAAIQLAEKSGDEVIPIAIRTGSPDIPIPGYHDLLNNWAHIISTDFHSVNMNSRKAAKKLVTILNEILPDVVAIPGYDSLINLTALKWCRHHNCGAILMSDSQYIDFKRSFWKEFAKQRIISLYDSAFIGGTPHVKYIESLGIAKENILTGYDVVDNEFWCNWAIKVRQQPDLWRLKLDLPENYFLTVCRLIPKKNIPGLLLCYQQYLNIVDQPWPLLIAGDGYLRKDLEYLVSRLGLSGNVRFLGYLSSEEMGPIYGLASVFILASAYSEQWGLVVNEAMAAGLPAFVSKICGCTSDLVIDGVTGYKFDPMDESELLNLMLKCNDGSFNLKAIGENAQKHISYYSPTIFAQNLMESAMIAARNAKTRRYTPWQFLLNLLN